MSTSPQSQYYHDQLYALATTWQQDPDHDSYTGPLPAPFLHYSQVGAHSAAGSLPPPSAPPAWTSGYVRHEPPEWHHAVTEDNFASRTAGAGSVLAGHASVSLPLPVPHQDPASLHYRHQQLQHQHQHQHQHPHQHPHPHQLALALTSEHILPQSPDDTVDSPFLNHASNPVPGSQPSPRQSQTAPLHAVNERAPLTLPATWETHEAPHRFPGHNSDALSTSVPSSGQDSSNDMPWPVVVTEGAPTVPIQFDRCQQADQEWAIAPVHSAYGSLAQHDASTDHHSNSSRHIPRPPQIQLKKKVAKVPSSFVERQEKLKVSKRKGPLPEKQREKTHTMRKTKRICVRCRFYKSGCDEGDPCKKCEKITGHARSFREPCYREHLEDTSLVRRCNGREHQEEAEFLGYDWIHNSQLQEMEILWSLPGYGPIPNAQPMRITFRPYSPRRGDLDITASLWSNKEGKITAIQQPAYAIYDTANLVPAFEQYFSGLQPAIEEWIFARIRQDEAAYLTYSEVRRMRSVKGSKALDLAMRLQCLSVVSQGYGSVWSNNIYGIREYDYRRLGRSDYEAYNRKAYDRPLPGAITHQMDVAAVKYLRKLEKLFVKELTALIFKPKIKPWYELFLAFYVVFWNLEYIQHGAQEYMRSKNGTLIERQVSNVVTIQIKKWEFAFPVLLYHWRCILRGYSPFKLARDNPEELCEKGHIDQEGFEYVTKIAHLFDRVNLDRYQPPLTGFVSTHWSTSSEWIIRLFKEAGA